MIAHVSPPLPEAAGYIALGVIATLALFAHRRHAYDRLHQKLRDMSAAHARLLLEQQQHIRTRRPGWLRRKPVYKGVPGFGSYPETSEIRVFRKEEK